MDAASNVASRTGPSATYTYDTADRLTSDGTRTFTWSDADRLTARGADTFGYDALDRLTSSTVAGSARTYAYSGDGLLQGRTEGSATSFLWDPATSPSRLRMQGSDKIVYGLGPLYAVRADGSTLTFARDGGKAVRAELDASGAVTAAFRYRAYGEIAQSFGAASPTYLGYAGQLSDPSGLLYMRARWYDPATGRFVSRDPMSGSPVMPTSLNAFGYASANPSTRWDPTRLASTTGELGGACVESRCAHPIPYNQTTVESAANSRMTWYLETASAAPQPRYDYVKTSISIAWINLDLVRDVDNARYIGLGLGKTALPFGWSETTARISGPKMTPEERANFISALTATAGLEFLISMQLTVSPSFPDWHAYEEGWGTPNATLGATYTWRR